jgi:hypothetical protein
MVLLIYRVNRYNDRIAGLGQENSDNTFGESKSKGKAENGEHDLGTQTRPVIRPTNVVDPGHVETHKLDRLLNSGQPGGWRLPRSSLKSEQSGSSRSVASLELNFFP